MSIDAQPRPDLMKAIDLTYFIERKGYTYESEDLKHEEEPKPKCARSGDTVCSFWRHYEIEAFKLLKSKDG